MQWPIYAGAASRGFVFNCLFIGSNARQLACVSLSVLLLALLALHKTLCSGYIHGVFVIVSLVCFS